MRGKDKIPFQVGWEVRRSGDTRIGTVRRIGKHLPAMIEVVWNDRSWRDKNVEWIPVGALTLYSLPENVKRVILKQQRKQIRKEKNIIEWFASLPDIET